MGCLNEKWQFSRRIRWTSESSSASDYIKGRKKQANIFKHLKEEEIEQLTLEIANTRSVSPSQKEEVLNEFYEVCLAQQYIAEGGIGYAKDLLQKCIGRRESQRCSWQIGSFFAGRHLSLSVKQMLPRF